MFDSVNFSRSLFYEANSTIRSVGLPVLWCPSDGGISGVKVLDGQGFAYCSYNTNGGLYYRNPDGPWTEGSVARLTALNARCGGIFFPNHAVGLNQVVDGTSSAILFAEGPLEAPGVLSG